ncbi:hypothetical protein NPIL_334891 [Nephila pilipes]|uniref:Uncharacterized protein n=1 Tax=Nephila pilipes TaxID=299642 RepID=A0A8X6TGS0_NEPPI|nr:hypothetical protein NPIL_334891 [Nephila pilipes]
MYIEACKCRMLKPITIDSSVIEDISIQKSLKRILSTFVTYIVSESLGKTISTSTVDLPVQKIPLKGIGNRSTSCLNFTHGPVQRVKIKAMPSTWQLDYLILMQRPVDEQVKILSWNQMISMCLERSTHMKLYHEYHQTSKSVPRVGW